MCNQKGCIGWQASRELMYFLFNIIAIDNGLIGITEWVAPKQSGLILPSH